MSTRRPRPKRRKVRPDPAPPSAVLFTQLERVLAEVREGRVDQLPPPADPADDRVLRCAGCGRAEPATADQVAQLARAGWPECCGKSMTLTAERPPAAAPGPERRGGARRPARPGVRTEVRRGSLGVGPDLGAGAVDVSADGARIRVRTLVRAGEEVEVTFFPPTGGPAVRGRGRVIWCRPAPGWAFLAGVRFRRRLAAEEVAALVE